MSTRAAGALSALSLSLLLLLASSSSSSFSSSLVVVAATDSLARGHFSVDARDVLADPKAAFLSWAEHVSRPVMLRVAAPSADGGDGFSFSEETTTTATTTATPRDCSRRWSPEDRARFDAWTANVLPRARRAIEWAFENDEGGQEEDLLRLPPPLPSSFAAPLPLQVNGIADLPLSTLKAGLLPARLNAEAAKEDEGFGAEAVATKLSEWLRFPYATEALLDASAAKEEEGSSSSSFSQNSISLSFSKRHKKHRRPLPASVDWSTKNVLGPVKNQHINGTPCGCCWSFATTGVVEGVVGVVSGKEPPSLSEQQLIDCDRGPPFDDLGCEGGSVEGGVYYIVENHGALDSEDDYPYSGIDEGEKACLRRKAKKSALDGSGARVVGFHDVPKKSEAALKAAVARHPVAVAVCCGDWIDDWHAYTGGIMTFNGTVEGCPKPLDHAVVVVGYGSGERDPTDPEGKRLLDYWIVKNSWGEQWGEKGFFKLARGLDAKEFPKGAAGLLSMPNFPIVQKDGE